MSKRTQQHRLLALKTPLGEDVLLAHRFHGTEELGRPFRYELEVVSEKADIKFEELLGKPIVLRVDNERDGERVFHGIVSRMSQTAEAGELVRYRIEVVPWLWLLTRTSDCRIFQLMSVPDIVKQVFRDRGFQDFEEKLNESYEAWEYCVQYRETDFNFVSRLLEQEGIYYYFRHEAEKHVLVLCDGPTSHEKFSGQAPGDNGETGGGGGDRGTIAFYPPTEGGMRDAHIDAWTVQKQVQPGAYALTDYNPLKPKVDLGTTSAGPREHAHGSLEMFDYPGEYATPGKGENWAKVRLQELQSHYEHISASTDCGWMSVGGVFKLEDPTTQLRPDQLRDYVVRSCAYRASQDLFMSGGAEAEGEPEQFGVQFTVIPHAQTFRPERVTPKPMVQGPQTAIVVGPSGEEIHTDEHGRVRVKFFWDRYGDPSKGDTSCWIRVAHSWAGKKWGSIFIPRVGHEVMVEFLEGDPDRPIVTGRVYNGEARAPYDLPGNKTQSGVKTRSSKGGSAENYNEIRFEDAKGSEQISIHAEKDMSTTVENDRTITIHGKHTETIKKDTVITITEGNYGFTVDKGRAEIGVNTGTMSVYVKDQVIETFKATQDTVVTSNIGIQSESGNIGVKAGGDAITLECGGSKLQLGKDGTLALDATKIVLTGKAEVTLVVGGNTVKVDPSGVTVFGTLVKIN